MPPPAVTHLFTDVEGSTRLWESEPQRIGPALARHDVLAREAVERHGGRIVKTTGDGVHAVFADPLAAVAAVVELQLGVARPPDGTLPLALRCGLHLGSDEQRDGDYFGPAVNRAARVMRAAHGGQVLLSAAVAERLAGRLGPELALRELGEVRLRDLARPERVFQLVHARLRRDFPPLRDLAATPTNLPQPLNSFVGRQRELAELAALLARHRLVTLVAMGGIGKSRLSLELGAALLDEHPDGVWLVELAALADPGGVAQAVASALGVREDGAGALADVLVRFVRDRRLLLVLDNCEHLVEACAQLARRLLQAGPGLRVLATSRDPLRIAGEQVYALQPLAVPEAGTAASPEPLVQHEAVRLFVDRATAAQPGFVLTAANAAAVASICRQLDGIPLALELAAARTRTLTVDAIAARLGDRFRLLVAGERTALPRQRTLRALIDWSHDLLPPAERTLFARLSVFAGGWTLEAAEAVGAGAPVDAADVVERLGQLVEKSLVTIDVESGRYRMLETVRQYAHERLVESGGEVAARARHLEHYAALVEQGRAHLLGPDPGVWMQRLDRERENILAAHASCAQVDGGAERDLRLVAALKYYWLNRGLLGLGLQVTLEALARPHPEPQGPARCRGLSDAGQIAYFMGRYAQTREHLGEALAIARRTGDAARLLAVLHTLAMVEAALGDTATGLAHCEEALGLATAVGPARSRAGVINTHGQLLRLAGELPAARRQFDAALALSRDADDPEGSAIALLNLAMVALDGGDGARAAALLDEVAGLAERTGSRSIGQSLLEVGAALAVHRGQWRLAAELCGAAEAQAERSGMRRDPADQRFLAPRLERLRERLGGDAAAAELAGRALPYEQALQRVRDALRAAPLNRS